MYNDKDCYVIPASAKKHECVRCVGDLRKLALWATAVAVRSPCHEEPKKLK